MNYLFMLIGLMFVLLAGYFLTSRMKIDFKSILAIFLTIFGTAIAMLGANQ